MEDKVLMGGKVRETRLFQADIVIVVDDIDTDDALAARQQRQGHMIADKARRPGHHHSHVRLTPGGPCARTVGVY